VKGIASKSYGRRCYIIYEHLCSPNQATRQIENRLDTSKNKSTHNRPKITQMRTNIKHSPERLTRQTLYEFHQIYDKTQI